jgi:hypothetical protein
MDHLKGLVSEEIGTEIGSLWEVRLCVYHVVKMSQDKPELQSHLLLS